MLGEGAKGGKPEEQGVAGPQAVTLLSQPSSIWIIQVPSLNLNQTHRSLSSVLPKAGPQEPSGNPSVRSISNYGRTVPL